MANQRVNPIPVTPPSYSFLRVAPEVPATTPPERWEDGWIYAPENCGTSGRVALNCRGGTDEMTGGATNPDDAMGTPFVVWAWDQCSMLGFAARDYEGRARRQLLATESYQVANELWTGSLRDSVVPPAKELDNLALTDTTSDTVTNGPIGTSAAFARLVGALSSCGMGAGPGMIHVTPQALSVLVADGAVRRNGSGVWVSAMDHVVVADGGYDGSGPGGGAAGSSQWMYATSMIYKRMSEVIIPVSFEQAVDRSVNTVRMYAQRLAGFVWDGCCHFAAEAELAVPLVGPPS